MDDELTEYLTAMEHRLNQKIEQVKTNLLCAFHGCAEQRIAGLESMEQ